MDFTRISRLADAYDMLPAGSTVLCAVSGGADSMCLLDLLLSLRELRRLTVVAVHFNHQLRGADSDGDAEFVRSWCAGHGVECVVGSGDVAAEAARTHRGVEETARAMRYAFFDALAEEGHAHRIATAHTADDNAETLLLRLARGTGLDGLCGIPPRRGRLIRPLLDTTREEILAYLAERNIPHREDASNADPTYARNLLRLQAVPALRQVNSRFSQHAAHTAALLREDAAFLRGLSETLAAEAVEQEGELRYPAAKLAELPDAMASRVAARLLERFLGDGVDVTAAMLESVTALCRSDDPSAQADLARGVLARREYEFLVLGDAEESSRAFSPTPLNPDGVTQLPGWQVFCRPCTAPEGSGGGIFYLDADCVRRGLLLRPRAAGDRLHLPGRADRPLKKIMIDAKIPRRLRESIPVLDDGLGPAAVAGFGPDVRCAALPGTAACEIRFLQTEK